MLDSVSITQASTGDRTRLQRMAAPAALVGGLGIATLALHARDPHVQGSWGACPSASIFGVFCPGCGGLRAVNDLGNGDVLSAASSNLLFVVMVPFIVLAIAVWSVDRWQGRVRTFRPGTFRAPAWGLLAATVVFTVLRNLSVGSWLAP